MAGIQSLLGGGAKTFAIDKLTESLPPQMRELLPLAINPQGYLVGKAVSSLADILGYGNQVRELQAGAKDEKDYYKETMRDAVGDMLPGAIGDFVRATPRGTTDEPAGTHWDPDTQNWKQSSNPVATYDPFASDRFGAGFDMSSPYNPNSQNFVGPNDPASMDDAVNVQNMNELYELLNRYQQPQVPNSTFDEYGQPIGSFATQTQDTSQNRSSEDEADDLMTSLIAFGGGTPEIREKGVEMMANGGFIYRGIR
jgi:hypothetical protein